MERFEQSMHADIEEASSQELAKFEMPVSQ